jgi:hypothetical protein
VKILVIMGVALSVLGMLGCIAVGLLTTVDGRHAAVGFVAFAVVASECWHSYWQIRRIDGDGK